MSQEIRARWESQRAGFAALRELPLAKADQEAGELIQMHDDIGVLLSENDVLRRQYQADGIEKAALLAQAQRDAEAVEVSRKNAREGWAAAHAAVDRAIAAEQENARLRERIESGKQAVELRERALAAAEQRVRTLEAEVARLNAKLDAGLTPRQEEAIKEYVVNATEALLAETARAQKAEKAAEQEIARLKAGR